MEAYWNRLKKRFGEKVDVAKAIAEGFLAAQPKEDLYPVTFEEVEANFVLTCLVKLSDEEIAMLKALSKEYEDPWMEYPELVGRLVDEEAPEINPINHWEVKSVGLSPEHSYLFTMAVFKNGLDKLPETKQIHISLSDAEYAAILAWKFLYFESGEGCISFNLMRQDLPELFEKISTMLEFTYCDCLFRLSDCPYAVFMDEAEEDFEEMKKGACDMNPES